MFDFIKNLFKRREVDKVQYNEELQEYINSNFNSVDLWFTKEVKKDEHIRRINETLKYKRYLDGKHKILQREDVDLNNGKVMHTKKLILNNAKTILNFHKTYLLGKSVSLTGSEDLVKAIGSIYKYGKFNNNDFKIISNLVEYGYCYEYVYTNKKDNITSKVYKPYESYPVYNNDDEYIAFIEYWIDMDNIEHYTVITDDTVEEWSNEGGLHRVAEYENDNGLPIYYGDDEIYESLLGLIMPILDELEDILSKMSDGIYLLSLNPISFSNGQEVEGGIDANGTSTHFNFEVGGEFKYVNANMDYNTIKLYLDTLQNNLNQIAYMPSVLGGNGNVANVSETSLKLLYQLADVYAMLSEKVIRSGFDERLNRIREILGLDNPEEYINVNFNYSRPMNSKELLENIKTQFDMGAISTKSIVEMSPLTNDSVMELNRLEEEGKSGVKEVEE